MNYFSQYRARCTELKNDLVVGIDPHTTNLPDFLQTELHKLSISQYLKRFCLAHIEAGVNQVAAVKFQTACFEAFGPEGVQALVDAVAMAKNSGLQTIIDAKRGDISSTMAAYGQAVFDQINGDCLTVVPYMGIDVLTAVKPWLVKGKAVYVVWVTSNPSGAVPQLLSLAGAAEQNTVAHALYTAISMWARREGAEDTLGFVLGAQQLDTMVGAQDPLKLADRHLLIPGFGAQKANAGVGLNTLRGEQGRGSLAIAMSRALSHGFSQQSCEATNWDQYNIFVASNLSNILKNL